MWTWAGSIASEHCPTGNGIASQETSCCLGICIQTNGKN